VSVPIFITPDGDFGDASGILILDPGAPTIGPDLSGVLDQMSSGERYRVAQMLRDGLGSIDDQDCPAMSYGMPCAFSGPVFRKHLDPARGADGGYTWECPMCYFQHEFEGVES